MKRYLNLDSEWNGWIGYFSTFHIPRSREIDIIFNKSLSICSCIWSLESVLIHRIFFDLCFDLCLDLCFDLCLDLLLRPPRCVVDKSKYLFKSIDGSICIS